MAKTALITGSTSGIGLSIAEAFARAGYQIIFNGLESDGAAIAKSLAANYNTEYCFSGADLTDPQQVDTLVAEGIRRFKTIDVLVNNAGIQFVSPVEDFPEEKWNQILSVNLNAAFLLSKRILPLMKTAGYGRIINIASAHGLIASAYKSAYIASKHGIIGLTKALAMEGGAQGITVNAICPGYVMTPLVEKQIPEQMKAHGLTREEVVQKVFLKDHVIKEFITPEAVASAAIFLAESAAAPFITGSAFAIDAGWTAH